MAMGQVPVRAIPRTPEVARGVAAAVAIVALIAGVPWALSTFVGWPLPSSIPSWSQITTALGDTYIPDAFLAKALAVVCWIVWIELVASLLVEAVAVVRGRQARRVPLTGPVQRLVARLVAAVSLMVILLLTRPDRTVQAVPVPSPAATAGVLASGAALTEPVAEEGTLPTYVVQRRDTLWGIAETYLRDPFRWVEIWERNQGRTQPDGATMVDPDRVYPGWVLELPGDAVGLRPPGSPVVDTAAPAPDGTESMTSLTPGEATPGGGGGATLLVSGGGVGGRLEFMVPLGPQLEQAEPESLLAAESHDDGAVQSDRALD
jgi:hypothetical protein